MLIQFIIFFCLGFLCFKSIKNRTSKGNFLLKSFIQFFEIKNSSHASQLVRAQLIPKYILHLNKQLLMSFRTSLLHPQKQNKEMVSSCIIQSVENSSMQKAVYKFNLQPKYLIKYFILVFVVKLIDKKYPYVQSLFESTNNVYI